MRTALLPNQTGTNRVTYWDFVNRKPQSAKTANADIIDFEPDSGIEVIEERFESMEDLLAHVKRVVGDLA